MANHPIPRPPWSQHKTGPGDVAPQAGAEPQGTGRAADAPASSPRPSETEQRAAALVAYLSEIEHGRQALVDALWSRLPVYVDERQFDPGGAATQVDVKAQYTQLVKITALIAVVPGGANAAATLTLGNRTYSLPGGITQWGGLCILLQPSDVRRLVSVNAGVIGLELMGEQVPVYGRVS